MDSAIKHSFENILFLRYIHIWILYIFKCIAVRPFISSIGFQVISFIIGTFFLLTLASRVVSRCRFDKFKSVVSAISMGSVSGGWTAVTIRRELRIQMRWLFWSGAIQFAGQFAGTSVLFVPERKFRCVLAEKFVRFLLRSSIISRYRYPWRF